MPQRHSKNNNDLSYFTYEERRRLGFGTQKERLGKDSLKPYDACCLCLKTVIDPMCCQKGHIFCKECIIECLLAQKKNIKKQLELFETQQRRDLAEQAGKGARERERQLEVFELQNSSAAPLAYDAQRLRADDDGGFRGASNSATTAFEEEAMKSMKAFWLPSKTPEAAVRVDPPSSDTTCPEGKERLRLKDLFGLQLVEAPTEEDGVRSVAHREYMCPSCKTTFTNASTLVGLSSCGHVLCARCNELFVSKDKACCVCGKACKSKQVVQLQKGGTGFAGHGDELVAKAVKLLGSGTGMAWERPTSKVQ